MRCPACNVESSSSATTCGACGAGLTSANGAPGPRRRRQARRVEGVDSPFAGRAEGPNGPALRAYRLSVLGLVPGLGLVLGPVAALLGLVAGYRARSDPDFTGRPFARAAVVLGLLTGVTNWVGLALMVVGLRSAGWLG
jgi:hypothetical protein